MTVHLQLMSHQKIGNNRIEFFSISYISICLFLDPGLVLCERPFVADLILYYLSLTEIYQQGKPAHLPPELDVQLNWLPGGKRWKRQALWLGEMSKKPIWPSSLHPLFPRWLLHVQHSDSVHEQRVDGGSVLRVSTADLWSLDLSSPRRSVSTFCQLQPPIFS